MSGPLGSRQFSEVLPPVLQLRPYQQRWIDDDSRFKGAVKSARIGFSFGTGIEALLDSIEHGDGGTTWTVLSASKAQGVEFVEMLVKNLKAIGAVGQVYDEPFADIEGESSITQTRVQIRDSRVIVLPANPRTARGYPGNAILDEFAHHQDSYAIWAAIARQVALGHKVRVLSTPNGEQGKFFDLARQFGLIDGVAPATNPVQRDSWSWHWVDVNLAIAEGCPINLEEMRNLFQDNDTFAQELLCVFLKAAGAWLSLELIARAEDAGATLDWPAGYVPSGPLFAGMDVGHSGDRSIFWLDELIGDVAWTRMVLRLHGVPFFTPDGEYANNDQARIVLPWVQLANRTAMDSTGIGLGLFEFLASKCPGRVMGVNFAGSIDAEKSAAVSKGAQTVKIKTDLAVRLKQRLEQGRVRLPHDPEIRQELQAIKREYSGGAVKFDAPRIEIDSAVAGGQKKKVYAHADSFWAKALAEFAAAGSPAAAFAGMASDDSWYRNERRGAMTEAARELASPHAKETAQPEMQRDRRSVWDARRSA